MTAPRPPKSGLVGSTLSSRYRVTDELGSGAMGVVYRAIDEHNGTEVAIKVLSAMAMANPKMRDELLKRFQREISTLRMLEHSNIVRLHDAGQTDGVEFLVLEFLDGRELRDELQEGRPMDPARVAHIGRQIALALDFAHGKGVVHRDLKPENVFLIRKGGDNDAVKVVDFGIARLQETHHEVTQVTKAGTSLGTPRYMSPEQALAKPITPMADLYGLGIMLYEMLSGDVPFHGDNPMMTAIAHTTEPPPPLEVPGMSATDLAPWQVLIGKLLEKQPSDRPQSAASVAGALRELGAGGAMEAGTPVSLANNIGVESDVRHIGLPEEESSGLPAWLFVAGGVVVAAAIATILAVAQ